MSEKIFIVERNDKSLTPIVSGKLSSIGVKERQELQEWIVKHPEVLGEELFILSKEFSQFEQSKRRIDILALDKNGKLVVVELKLELEGTFADLQALRYAAFCSSMTISDIIGAYSNYKSCSTEDARDDIEKFLGPDGSIVLDKKPRIILAASSMDDQELTGTVLWLRSFFGVDITCIELVPFYLEGAKTHILYPKTVIPLPETIDFQIRMERQEASQDAEQKKVLPYSSFWQLLKEEYDKLNPVVPLDKTGAGYFLQILPVSQYVHYEWQVYQRPRCIRASIHFESDNPSWNLDFATKFLGKIIKLPDGSEVAIEGGQWGKTWARASLETPYSDSILSMLVVSRSALLMDCLIKQTKEELAKFNSEVKQP